MFRKPILWGVLFSVTVLLSSLAGKAAAEVQPDHRFLTKVRNATALLPIFEFQEKRIAALSTDQKTKRVESIDPIRLNLPIRGVGRLEVSLGKVWLKTWTSLASSADGSVVEEPDNLLLLKGSYRVRSRLGRTEKKPLAASVVRQGDGSYTAEFDFHVPGRRKQRRTFAYQVRLSHIGQNPEHALASIRRKPISIDFEKACGSTQAPVPAIGQIGEFQLEHAEAISGIITISTEADKEFAEKNPDTNNRIAAILNQAETFYQPLNLKFAIAQQHVFTTANPAGYNTKDPSELLRAFRGYTSENRHLGGAHLYHLFTGKDLKAGVIGIAYIGVLCHPNKTGAVFGLTQHLDGITEPIISAHEIGHNVGGRHVDDKGSLMYPQLGPGTGGFSSGSLAEIEDYLSLVPNCLNEAPTELPIPDPTPIIPTTDTPDPDNVNLLITTVNFGAQRGVRIVTRAVTDDGQVLGNAPVEFWYQANDTKPLKKVGLGRTDDSGFAILKPAQTGLYFGRLIDFQLESAKIAVQVTQRTGKRKKRRRNRKKKRR